MGLFRKRRDAQASEAPDAVAPPPRALSPEEDRFATTIARGDLQAAAQLLDAHVAAAAPVEEPGDSLLERAAFVRRALREDRLDDAAEMLAAWELSYAAFGKFLDAEKAATLNTLGLLLLDYFAHPRATSHAAYDTLMDRSLAGVAKATRLGSPTRQTPWDPVYARIKSDRELSRAR